MEGTQSALAVRSARGGGLVLADLSNTASTAEGSPSRGLEGLLENDGAVVGRIDFPQPAFALDFDPASGIAELGSASASILLASVL